MTALQIVFSSQIWSEAPYPVGSRSRRGQLWGLTGRRSNEGGVCKVFVI
jgi:hypothetical protein